MSEVAMGTLQLSDVSTQNFPQFVLDAISDHKGKSESHVSLPQVCPRRKQLLREHAQGFGDNQEREEVLTTWFVAKHWRKTSLSCIAEDHGVCVSSRKSSLYVGCCGCDASHAGVKNVLLSLNMES